MDPAAYLESNLVQLSYMEGPPVVPRGYAHRALTQVWDWEEVEDRDPQQSNDLGHNLNIQCLG